MATANQNLTSFSYAQAAKGRATTANTQLSAPKETPRSETMPAATTLTESGSWADDGETVTQDKIVQNTKESIDLNSKSAQPKDGIVEQIKTEGKDSPNISSPEFPATASVTTDDSSSRDNGPASDSTWETKSQTSEPAWVAERKERQSNENTKGVKGGKKNSKESSPVPSTPVDSKPLQDALPPTVNPWTKRAEDKAKSMLAVQNSVPRTTAPVLALDIKNNNNNNNNNSKTEHRKKFDHVASHPVVSDSKKPNGIPGARNNEHRGNKHNFKSSSDDVRGGAENTASAKPTQRDSNIMAPPPPPTDESSWPTPEIAQDKERKNSQSDKDVDESADADASQGTKVAKKNWQQFPVTPNIIWATQEMNRPRGPGGDKAGRSGNSTRGRGGFRGGSSGPKGGDRVNAKTSETEPGARGRQAAVDKDSMPPPAKPARPASVGQSRDRSSKVTGTDTNPSIPATSTGQNSNVPLSNLPSNKQADTGVAMSVMGHDVAKGANFVPRGGSASFQNKDQLLNNNNTTTTTTTRDTHATKNTAESRKEHRSFETYGKEWNGASRGGKRGGRGRGGSREFANGHQAYPAYNGYHDVMVANGFTAPTSPSGFQAPRGSHQFGHHHHQQQQGRGGWSRNGQRAQSTPDGGYGPRAAPFTPMQQPMQSFMPPPMYENSFGFMVPALPRPVLEPGYLLDQICTQIEYYFSAENLLKDLFLRSNMDSQGFVLLDVIASFKRVKDLTFDRNMIIAACLSSQTLEVCTGSEDNMERLRLRNGWHQWVRPTEERVEHARNDGPRQVYHPEAPLGWGFPASGSRNQGVPAQYPRRSYDSGLPVMDTFQPHLFNYIPTFNMPNADEEMRGRTPKSPIRDLSRSHATAPANPVAENDAEADSFSDDDINSLTVILRTTHSSSHTCSNGSVDAPPAFPAESERSGDGSSRPVLNGELPSTNGDSVEHEPSRDGDEQRDIHWSKDKTVSSEHVLEGTSHEPYPQLHEKAIKQRDEAASGTCPDDLQALYTFWSHFLIGNFNKKVYDEFHYLAMDDANQRHSIYGVQRLAVFYERALLSSSSLIRDSVVKDYVGLVNNEPADLDGQAFKQLRSAWRNGALNLKNRKKLNDIVDDNLRRRLES